ncbi:hypothetical protein ES707_20024 [subsurface metagenome]
MSYPFVKSLIYSIITTHASEAVEAFGVTLPLLKGKQTGSTAYFNSFTGEIT